MTHTVDPFDELAALFLTGPDARGAPVQTAAPVELLVVGHLPVRADLWLTPYADALARDEGPAAIVRLDAGQPTLQLVRSAETPHQPAGAPVLLGEAAARLAGTVARWIVRVPTSATAQELLEAEADRITVLTSVDELARVRAFERLKTLAEAARRVGAAPPALGFAVIGASLREAEEVAGRIRQVAAAAGLGIDPALVACVERIDSAVRAGDRMAIAPDGLETLRSVVEGLRAGLAAAPPHTAAPPVQPPQRVFRQTVPPDAPPDPSAPPRIRAARVPPKPSIELEAKHPVKAREPDCTGAPVMLSQFVSGLAALPVRCPNHERVELGVDAGGRLHVIAREPDMRGLHKVRAWAIAHREVIAMACRDHWLDPSAVPVCHVFTDRPATLADLHESGLRLHVLAPVTVEGRQGWYHAPLNAELR